MSRARGNETKAAPAGSPTGTPTGTPGQRELIVSDLNNYPSQTDYKLQPGTTYLTQAPIPTQPPTPDIIRNTLFAQESVKVLRESDFTLDSKQLIGLKYDDCILVLFYVENAESQQLVKVWSVAAQQVVGPVFAAVNLMVERRIANAFTKIGMEGSHPLYWTKMKSLPFIIVYRAGWPVAFYNGAREVGSIIDYSLTMACRANYYEPIQGAGGMQAESRVEMGPVKETYGTGPVRASSSEYSINVPVRGFQPTEPLVAVGSVEAGAEAKRLGTENIREQRATQQLRLTPGSNVRASPRAPTTTTTTTTTNTPR